MRRTREVLRQSSMTIAIKVLQCGDDHLLRNVTAGLFDNPIDPALTAEFLGDPRHHLAVAIVDHRVVGFASGVHYIHPDKPPQLWINEVAVSDAYRRRGLAKSLLGALLDVGREHRCTVAWVLTDQTNAAAMALYASVGGTQGADDQSPDAPTLGCSFDLSKK